MRLLLLFITIAKLLVEEFKVFAAQWLRGKGEAFPVHGGSTITRANS